MLLLFSLLLPLPLLVLLPLLAILALFFLAGAGLSSVRLCLCAVKERNEL